MAVRRGAGPSEMTEERGGEETMGGKVVSDSAIVVSRSSIKGLMVDGNVFRR